MDIKHELFRERGKGEKSEFEKVIDRTVEIACNHLVPEDFAEFHWKSLNLLFAIHETVSKETVQEGLNYLKVEVPNYWSGENIEITIYSDGKWRYEVV